MQTQTLWGGLGASKEAARGRKEPPNAQLLNHVTPAVKGLDTRTRWSSKSRGSRLQSEVGHNMPPAPSHPTLTQCSRWAGQEVRAQPSRKGMRRRQAESAEGVYSPFTNLPSAATPCPYRIPEPCPLGSSFPVF